MRVCCVIDVCSSLDFEKSSTYHLAFESISICVQPSVCESKIVGSPPLDTLAPPMRDSDSLGDIRLRWSSPTSSKTTARNDNIPPFDRTAITSRPFRYVCSVKPSGKLAIRAETTLQNSC